MSVDVVFEPGGLSGRVAEGTLLIDAAKRMGAWPTRNKLVNCIDCVVTIAAGHELLSAATPLEQSALGQRLSERQRLACQARLETSGEVVIELMNTKNSEPRTNPSIRQQFRNLPLSQKLATLLQLEVTTVSEVVDEIAQRSLTAGEKVLDAIGRRGSSKANNSTSEDSQKQKK